MSTSRQTLRRQLSTHLQRSQHKAEPVFKEEGPQHNRRYLCDYVVIHKVTGAFIKVEGVEWKPSKAEAEEATAVLALDRTRAF